MFKGFLDGYASVGDIFGIRKIKPYTVSSRRDEDKIKQDWDKVGQSIWIALSHFKTEEEKGRFHMKNIKYDPNSDVLYIRWLKSDETYGDPISEDIIDFYDDESDEYIGRTIFDYLKKEVKERKKVLPKQVSYFETLKAISTN